MKRHVGVSVVDQTLYTSIMRHRIQQYIFANVCCLLLASTTFATNLKPLQDWMQSLIDDGEVVGCMAQVTQDGETIFLEAVGDRTPESDEDVEVSQVIRIYSMSKAITSAAIMQLVEQGKLGIDDPVSLYIPEFAAVQVLENGELRPAKRGITIRELLTHTSGLAYDFSASPELKPYYEGKFIGVKSLKEAAKIIASLPLAGDPGNLYLYGLSIDVLGRVVEVVSEQEFETYLQKNIFAPLAMNDTSFTPDMSVLQMPIVNRTEDGLQIDKKHYETERDVLNPSFHSGGGGLWSTIGDYSKFCMAVEQYGELDGKRILQPQSVRFMTQNQLSPAITTKQENRFGLGFGLGAPVLTSRGIRGAGRWTWGGAASTYFFIDPAQDVTAVFATQLFPFDFELNNEFHYIVLESLVQEESN